MKLQQRKQPERKLRKQPNMNSVDMANALIDRAKNLQEFIVETEVPEDFRFNGLIPFDMTINEGMISAKVFALDFDEAVKRLDDFLEGQK
jgi:hypothetical protein